MTTWTFEHSAVFESADHADLHDVRIGGALPFGNWYETIFLTFEAEYSFLVNDLTPLPEWHPTAIGVYVRPNIVAGEAQVLQDIGGDWMHYQGLCWDHNVIDLGAGNLLYEYRAHAPGQTIHVQGRRTMGGDFFPDNGLWISCGSSQSGSANIAYAARDFWFRFNARILSGAPS